MQVIARVLFAGACLALTAVASVMTSWNLDARAEDQFAKQVNDAKVNFNSRLNAYVHSLDSAAAFVASTPDLDAADWHNFVELVDINKNLPGVSALGLIRAVPDIQLADFVEKRRKDGMDDYSVHPEVKTSEHLVIELMEPLSKNNTALGLDLMFDKARHQVLEDARNSGAIVLSSPLSLVQHPSSPGFLFARAVYSTPKDSAGGSTPRPRIFHGWVAAPFIGAVTLANLAAQQTDFFDLAVYDVSDGTDGVLIYDHKPDDPTYQPKFAVTLTEPIYGRNWSMHFTSTRSFDGSVKSYAPLIALIAGLFTSVLLCLLMEILVRRVNTVNSLVARRTKELKARVEENKSIVESAYVPIIILNEHDEIIQANAAALALLGYSQLFEIKRMPISSYVYPVAQPDQSERAGFGGWSHVGANGRLLNVRRSSWTGAKGDQRHSLIIQDVTEEANTARRIAEAEQRWHIALNGSDIGVFDIDLRTGRSIVSEAWKRVMQVEDESADFDSQAEFLSRINAQDLDRLQDADLRCINGETERSICEYRISDRDGNWRWMRSDAAVVERSQDGKALRMIGAQMDVTDLRMARDALEVSQKRFELMISEAPVGMAVFTNDGVFLNVNDALCQFLGYRADEILGGVRISDVLDKTVMKAVIGLIGPQAVDRSRAYHGEHEWTASDGSKIWALLSISWTFDPEEQGDIYIAQLSDITEKKHIERIKSEFVATVSHELRTPLTSIKGALSLLETSPEFAQGPTKRLLDIARRNSDRLGAIVNDILDFEKLSSEQISFDVAAHPLKKVILDAATLIESMAAKGNVSIKLDLPDDPMMAMIDPARTHQVLANLLSNACKFSFPSSEIEVRSGTVDNFHIVYICNRGCGIPASFRSQIFKPFVQADNSAKRQFEGTGLGLHIAQKIVNSMGGRIGFTSEPNKLTVFWFTVPIAHQETVKVLRVVGGES
ncbi:CHASE domain-containing protein [Pseudorhodobacter sp. W20_MBD10_FR17]|uniref:CHASE domain-containing protein n=1 Tax=Pseudorhodobacter sp. W20_MBD10_FR17 TaxID=3240266 RepID=UPI003F9DA9C8